MVIRIRNKNFYFFQKQQLLIAAFLFIRVQIVFRMFLHFRKKNKVKKIILLLAFSVSFLSNINAQITDSIKTNQNEVSSIKSAKFNFKSYKDLILPSAFVIYGFSSLGNNQLREWNVQIKNSIVENHPGFHTKFDNYLQFYPSAATFALKLAGVKGQNDLLTSAKIYATSTLLMAGSVYALKNITGQLRPDGSTYDSFPSGHTATAFAAAEFMRQEFKNTSLVLSYSGYLAASATGALRLYNNRHYLSDVIAGAGIGILTTKAAYWLNEKVFVSHKSKVSNSF